MGDWAWCSKPILRSKRRRNGAKRYGEAQTRVGDRGRVRQIADAVVRLNQSKKQHPILICDEAHLLPHPALEQLPLWLNFDMDSSRYLTLLLIGQPLLRRTLSLQMHEALRQRVGTHYHLEGLTREELELLSGAATQGRRREPTAV